jgi:hypothetical protein
MSDVCPSKTAKLGTEQKQSGGGLSGTLGESSAAKQKKANEQKTKTWQLNGIKKFLLAARAQFNKIDTDESGAISLRELFTALRRDDELKAMYSSAGVKFADIDVTNDNLVSFDEFVVAFVGAQDLDDAKACASLKQGYDAT